jgi:hypothetical protein
MASNTPNRISDDVDSPDVATLMTEHEPLDLSGQVELDHNLIAMGGFGRIYCGRMGNQTV